MSSRGYPRSRPLLRNWIESLLRLPHHTFTLLTASFLTPDFFWEASSVSLSLNIVWFVPADSRSLTIDRLFLSLNLGTVLRSIPLLTMARFSGPSYVLLAASLLGRAAWAIGRTQCASQQLDWYTDFIGETPCKTVSQSCMRTSILTCSSFAGETYQRLRQICNNDCEP